MKTLPRMAVTDISSDDCFGAFEDPCLVFVPCQNTVVSVENGEFGRYCFEDAVENVFWEFADHGEGPFPVNQEFY